MKVINVASNYSSKYAGNFIPSLLEIATMLQNTYAVIFSFPLRAKERFWVSFLKQKRFKVFFFDASSNKKILKDLKKINKGNNVSLFYSHFISTPIIKLLSPISRRLKIIIHIHSDFSNGNTSFSPKRIIKKIIFEKLIRTDASYIYVSSSMMKKDNNKNSHYVSNALSIKRIINPSNSKDYSSLFANDKIKFLSFGWSPRTKGIDIICKAFLELDDIFRKNAILYIVVNENGTNDCLGYIKNVLNLDLNAFSNVVLLEPQEDVFRLYKMSDVFISSSRSEGFSYSVLEALYCGLDVFCSNIDGTKWSYKYGAIPFESNNYRALKELMERAIKFGHKERKQENKIIDTFSISKWANRIFNIIDEKMR